MKIAKTKPKMPEKRAAPMASAEYEQFHQDAHDEWGLEAMYNKALRNGSETLMVKSPWTGAVMTYEAFGEHILDREALGQFAGGTVTQEVAEVA